MPIKRRTTKRKYVVTPDVRMAAFCGESSWDEYWGGPEAGRRAWEALRDQLCAQCHLGMRDGVFWSHEADVPEPLRKMACPYERIEDPDLEPRALKWLLASDHLRDGETKVIARDLEQLEAERTDRITEAAMFRRDFTDPAEEDE